VRRVLPAVALLALAWPSSLRAQSQTDEYTKYELLAPETAQFRIYYDVTAISPGATWRPAASTVSRPS
jgi:hypothetical protein